MHTKISSTLYGNVTVPDLSDSGVFGRPRALKVPDPEDRARGQ